MITLKQLAELSGTSIRTVRRVLDNYPHVNSEKRKLILDLAKKYNYVPNMAARSLRLQKKNFVGILFSAFDKNASLHKLNLLNEALINNGFYPLLGKIAENNQLECEKMFANWAGIAEFVVVFIQADHDFTQKEFLSSMHRKYPLKFIFADCDMHDAEYIVAVDRVGSVEQMVHQIAEMGFKHFLYCGKLPSRKQGIEKLMNSRLPMQISMIESDYEFENGELLGDSIASSNADVVFFDTDRMAAGFYSYAQKHRIKIPEDIAVVGLDNEIYGSYLNPPLSTLSHPSEELIQRIMDIILKGKCALDPLPLKFIVRESLQK
ncbi:MAG: LacI family DNA-binding transcriptional regulator [Lentisphaeria bacterium]|nr:LacI family DNA-binding transcriptional regulator [Lentisphaeria bacterium]